MGFDAHAALTELPIAWAPTPEYQQRSRLGRFMRSCGFEEYETFLAWSQERPAEFWNAVVRDLDLEFYELYETTVDLSRYTSGFNSLFCKPARFSPACVFFAGITVAERVARTISVDVKSNSVTPERNVEADEAVCFGAFPPHNSPCSVQRRLPRASASTGSACSPSFIAFESFSRILLIYPSPSLPP